MIPESAARKVPKAVHILLHGNPMKSAESNCQSCGMPFDKAHTEFIAKEADGSKSIFCTYCCKDGEFIDPNAKISDMIEMGVPYLAQKIGEKSAYEFLSKFVPTLKRWCKT